MNTVIILLGAPNNSDGSLTAIAKSRCDKAYQIFLQQPYCKLLCTGGFGAHFNTTNIAHGDLTKAYLIKLGVPASAFLPVALSRFTFEDATLAQPILASAGAKKAILVSSEFHIARVHYVFSHVFPHIEFICEAAITPLPKAELEQLAAHEEHAMEREKVNVKKL
ncbi:YdcF family protein [Pseudoalteromonas prydzensis]|uniref:YdcF family protein n=1 Tax=Pseudoalteromonas prydzensis TaxID=182141 RepID=UPI0024BCE055|nr:YdcF family protein [Pseudoalteromonas prydzensis]